MNANLPGISIPLGLSASISGLKQSTPPFNPSYFGSNTIPSFISNNDSQSFSSRSE